MYSYMFDLVTEAKHYGTIPHEHEQGQGRQHKHKPYYFDSCRTTDIYGQDPLFRQPLVAAANNNNNNEIWINIDDAIQSVGMNWWGVQGRLWLATGLLLVVDSMELALLSFVSKTAQSAQLSSSSSSSTNTTTTTNEEEELQLQPTMVQWLPYLADYYNYNDTVAVFLVGTIVGAILWGMLADVFGRRNCTLAIALTITLFGFLMAACCCHVMLYYNDFYYQGLLAKSFMVGLGLGGFTIPYDFLAEWLPNRTTRGQWLLPVQLSWTAGSWLIFVLLKSIPRNYCPWIIVICALPAAVALLVLILPLEYGGAALIPESPRWLLSQGRHEEALAVLRDAAQANGKHPERLFSEFVVLYSNESTSTTTAATTTTTTTSTSTSTRQPVATQNNTNNDNDNKNNDQAAIVENGQENGYSSTTSTTTTTTKNNTNRAENETNSPTLLQATSSSSPRQVLPISVPSSSRRSWREVCSLFSLRWIKLSSAMLTTYFGQAFCYHGTIAMSVDVFSQDARQQNYQAIFSAGAEVLGIVFVMLAINQWGRIPTQLMAYGISAMSCLTLALWYALPFLENGNTLIVLVFLGRLFAFGGGATTWVSTTEVLSTEIRTAGHALVATMGRLGGLASSLILNEISFIPTESLVVFVIGLWIAFACTDIPETHVKEMGLSYQFLSTSAARTSQRRPATAPRRQPPPPQIHVPPQGQQH